jgi:hypothetical protein
MSAPSSRRRPVSDSGTSPSPAAARFGALGPRASACAAAYLGAPPPPCRAAPAPLNPSACSAAPNPSRQRRCLGPRHRIKLVPPSPVRRLGVALWNRRSVRDPRVSLVWASMLHAAGTPSPELLCRRGSPCAVVPRRRRLGRPQSSSPACARRSGAIPVIFGAPQRQAAVAPPPSLAAGRTPPLLPLAQDLSRQISIRRPPLALARQSNQPCRSTLTPRPH